MSPTRAKKVCGKGHVYDGAARCPVCHDRFNEQAQIRKRAKQNPYTAPRWREASKAFLADHPCCECPECLAKPWVLRDVAVVVDHIDGEGLTGDRAWDPANWRALSRAHHARKTNASDGGWGRPVKRQP